MTDKLPTLKRGNSVNTPLVSIIMPTYNRATQIGDSIRSLLYGEFNDFELLIRDDGDGKDGTKEAVEIASNGDLRIKYHRNCQNLGMPENLNAGIKESSGSLIAVCHDHDIYKSSFLSEMVTVLERYPGALFVHCAIDVVDQSGNYVCSHIGDWPELSKGLAWLKFMLGNLSCPVCALTIVRRSAYETYGLYDPLYGFISDIEMWMRLSLHGDVAYVSKPLIQVREREDDHVMSMSVNSDRMLSAIVNMHIKYIPYVFNKREQTVNRLLLYLQIAYRRVINWLSRQKRLLLTRL